MPLTSQIIVHVSCTVVKHSLRTVIEELFFRPFVSSTSSCLCTVHLHYTKINYIYNIVERESVKQQRQLRVRKSYPPRRNRRNMGSISEEELLQMVRDFIESESASSISPPSSNTMSHNEQHPYLTLQVVSLSSNPSLSPHIYLLVFSLLFP